MTINMNDPNILVPCSLLVRISEYLELYCDDGPDHAPWQSQELMADRAAVDKLLKDNEEKQKQLGKAYREWIKDKGQWP